MYSELGPHGDLLLGEFEAKKGGGLATEAYRCPGGRWTLGLGATQWPDGRRVGSNEFCTMEQAVALTNWSLRKFSAVVDGFITKPMTQNQRAAFILLAYNIGPHAFRTDCAASRLFNQGSPSIVVATAFGKWCKATNDEPEEYDLDDPLYMPIIGKNKKGEPCWIDQNGTPCNYRRALPGLLRRHLSEACLFMDLDWRQACRKNTVSIIAEREWDAKEALWEDLVQKKTELADVLPVARQYPLTNTTGKPAIAIAGAAEPMHESGALPAATEPSAPETAPALNADSSVDIRAASEADPEAKDKGGGAGLPASQPEVPAPLPHGAPSDLILKDKVPAGSVESSGPAAEGAAIPNPPLPPKVQATIPPRPPAPAPPIGQQRDAVNATTSSGIDPSNAKSMILSRRFWGLFMIITGRIIFALTGVNTYLTLASDPIISELIANVAVMLASSAWEYCGECIHTWGKARAKRPLR
jgi:GH24 family phage-related lysozyme (muramidase)